MRKLRSTYVHRGDAVRRRNRLKRFVAWGTVLAVALFVIANRQPSAPVAEAAANTPGSSSAFRFGLLWENRRLRREIANAAGDATLLRATLERNNRIIGYSAKYDIAANLAAVIFDVALQEGLDPELAFRVVQLESGFNPRAVSRVGAIGLVQLMPATARQFDRSITREKLYDAKTNATIGFRYLRQLISNYGGNVRLALLAYNIGEPAVDRARRNGKNPLDGYNRILIKDYRGSGVTN
jgi:soluble lytic murein transglycosylase-like protein